MKVKIKTKTKIKLKNNENNSIWIIQFIKFIYLENFNLGNFQFRILFQFIN